MDWKTFIPAVIGTFIVVLGWVVVHYLTKRREIAAEKRKIRVSFLIEAYRRLERIAERRTPQGDKAIEDIESAIADIQLLGTPEQVALAHSFGNQCANTETPNVKDLLLDLRRTLRSDLDLEPVETDVSFLRIKP